MSKTAFDPLIHHLTHEERQRLIHAPITRGVLGSTQYHGAIAAGGFSINTPSDNMPGHSTGGRARHFRKLPTSGAMQVWSD